MAEWSGVDLEGLVLHSGRLTLRPWQPEDAPAVRAIMADERMHQHLLAVPWPYTAEDARGFVTEHAQSGRTAGVRLDCAIAENAGGRLVGSATLRLPTGGDTGAEIGYWIAVPDWGQGYATEATQTLTRFGLANGLARIQIRCETTNAASAAVALRAGYAFEGISRASLRSGGLGGEGVRDGAVFARTAGDPDKAIPPSWPKLEPLSDGVVTLRPAGPEDWPVLLAEANNEAARQWALHPAPMPEAAVRRMTGRAALDRLVGNQNLLLICEAASGAGAGMLSLRRVGPPNVVALGYGVLPEFRGRGFTTRALRLLADWAFSTTPIVRLELGCKAANVASARAAQAAGFTQDARMASRLANPDGSHSDEIGFGLVRPAG